MTIADWVTAAFSLLSMVVSIFAIIASTKQAAAGRALQQHLAESTRSLQSQIDARDRSIENRRFVTTELWDRMTQLNHIDPASPVAEDARRAVNTLEFVALCWRAGLVDKDMVVIAFGSFYDALCHELQQTNTRMPGLHKTGYELLAGSPVIGAVRQEIQAELQKQGQLPAVA